MEKNYYEEVINWHELAIDLLDDMRECYGEKQTAQWLWDDNFTIGAINYLLGTNYDEDDVR